MRRTRSDCLANAGWMLYFYALTAHFGTRCDQQGKRARQWIVAAGLLYGQIKKSYRQRCVVRVEYHVQRGQFEELEAHLKTLDLTGRLNTAFVGRLNLTIRQAIAPFLLYLGNARTLLGLQSHAGWWRACYHFIHPRESLRLQLAQPIE